MKYSYKLSDAIHILSYIYIYRDGDLSSRMIASSIESNPSVVRQLMSDLRKAGLIETHKGAVKPRLSRTPQQITLLDVYQAINMDHDLLHVDPKTNPNCIVGGNIQDTLNTFYSQIQQAAFSQMKNITLQDIIGDILLRQQSKSQN